MHAVHPNTPVLYFVRECSCFTYAKSQVTAAIARSFGQRPFLEVYNANPIVTGKFRLGQKVQLELWICQFTTGQDPSDEARELGRVLQSRPDNLNLVVGGGFNLSSSSNAWLEMKKTMRPVSETAEATSLPWLTNHDGDQDKTDIWVSKQADPTWGADACICPPLEVPKEAEQRSNARLTRAQQKAAVGHPDQRLVSATFPYVGIRKAC